MSDDRSLSPFAKDLKSALDSFERETVESLCGKLARGLQRGGEKYPETEVARVLKLLRRKRRFDLLESTALQFIRCGHDGPVVRRHFAQALLDQGKIAEGLLVLRELSERVATDPSEGPEVRGLIGRAYKQIYVSSRATRVRPTPRRR